MATEVHLVAAFYIFSSYPFPPPPNEFIAVTSRQIYVYFAHLHIVVTFGLSWAHLAPEGSSQ
jgi:hypothetical protein